MIRFPFTLEMWYEEEATLRPDLQWDEGVAEWRTVGRCNVRQNGQAREVKGANGQSFLYSFEVEMPPHTQPIAINTRVRVLDSRGFNIFDRTPRSDNRPVESVNAGGARSFYTVQGFYKSGQRNEVTKLWL